MRRTVTTIAVALALMAPAVPAAHAKGREVIRTGACTGSADWKLKVKRDNGRLEVEWEVDSNRSGQTWRVRVRDNGHRVITTRRLTRPPSGSFEVNRRIVDLPGTDRIVARSRHLAGGQLCRGVVTF